VAGSAGAEMEGVGRRSFGVSEFMACCELLEFWLAAMTNDLESD